MASRSNHQRLQGARELSRLPANRPAVLRLGLWGLAGIGALCLVTPAAAARHRRHQPKAPATQPQPPLAPATKPAAPPRIPLQRNLRFVIRPTLLGLLPPPDPLDYGEAYVRVLGADNRQVQLRYEIKEQLDRDSASGTLYQLGSAPASARTQPVTRIRRGTLTAARSGGQPQLTPPMFWPDGSWQSTDGLLWLAPATLQALQAGEAVPWQVDFPASDVPLAEQFKDIVALRRAAASLQPGEPLTLKLLDAHASYRCLVNGASVSLPAVRAVDSLLLGEYWLLNDQANPLLLKLNYLPLQEADPASSGWAALLNAGGGCAVTQIDW